MNDDMRSIAIIGAGQAGLQLANHLLQLGKYKVSLYSDRTANDIKYGSILSSQGMFETALEKERKLSLNFWDNQCPKNTAVTFSLATPNSKQPAIYWQGKTKPAQSVDQRIKFSYWLDLFVKKGGELYIQTVDFKSLDYLASRYDLVVVASGKGELKEAFAIDASKTHFSIPQRVLCCLYVKNMTPASGPSGVRVNVIPGVGEYFTIPGLTHSGLCEMMLFEGVPSGAFDCWEKLATKEYISMAKQLLKEFVPWEARRCEHIDLTDEKAILAGSISPVVRYPTLTLPCGKSVLGLGDVIVLNDPIAGQGSNHASKSAYLYAQRIYEQNNKPFDQAWMEKTAELSWEKYGKYSTLLSSLLLSAPPAHLIGALQTAEKNQYLADMLAQGFDKPETVAWLNDALETSNILGNLTNSELI